jgi:hypothetical protein
VPWAFGELIEGDHLGLGAKLAEQHREVDQGLHVGVAHAVG